VEAATATEQREMLEAAFVAVHGPKPERVHGGSPELLAWLALHNPFFALLQAGGFLDAAMSLVPSEMLWSVEWAGHQTRGRIACCTIWKPHMPSSTAVAATPALALTAACLRARAMLEQGNG
jgi:hypothetical protein